MGEAEKEKGAQEEVEPQEELTEEELEELRLKNAKQASTDLLGFCRDNNCGEATKALEIAARVDLTAPGSYWSSLHYAALHGNAPLVDGLISAGANKVHAATRLPAW